MAVSGGDLPARVVVLEEIARGQERRLNATERRFDGLDAQVRELREVRRDDFRLIVRLFIGGYAAMAAGFGSILAVMAHGFHWL